MPKISVVLPVYNSEEYLIESLESISNQTFRDFEIIAINDGSTDNSLEILKNYARKEPRLRIISRENKGITKTLNEGIELSKGDFIARMDSDDICLPLRFEKQLEYIINKNLDVCGTKYQRIGLQTGIPDLPISCEDCYFRLLFGSAMAHPSILLRKSIIKKYRYNENFKYAQDYELWCRMALDKIKIGNVPEVLFKYRFSSNNISVAKKKEQSYFAQIAGKNYWENTDISRDIIYPLCSIDTLNNSFYDLNNSIKSLLKLQNRLTYYNINNNYFNRLFNSKYLILLSRLSVYGLLPMLPFLKRISGLSTKTKIIYSLMGLTRIVSIKEKSKEILPEPLKGEIKKILYKS